MTRQAKCPTCKKIFNTSSEYAEAGKYFPFCSERCKKVDFQGWTSGRYRISRPLRGDDVENPEPSGSEDDGTNDSESQP